MKKNHKIIIITTGFSEIVSPITENFNVCGIIECAPRNLKQINNDNLLLKFYKFIFRKKGLKEFCAEKKIPYFYMTNCNKQLENWVKNLQPDIMIIYSMSRLLKKNIFNIPKYGTINLHPSLLPKYRGPNPWLWHYYFMDKKGGVTLHFIDEGEDTGDIIFQEEFNIFLGMKLSEMQEKAIKEIGISLIFKALENIENLPRIKQPDKSPTIRARNINIEEYKLLIDWKDWDIERIWHFLRGTEALFNLAFPPNGIFTNQKWEVSDFKRCDTSNYITGKIYREKGKYFIACRDGKVYLTLNFKIKNLVKKLI